MFILLMISILVFMIAIQVSRRKTEVNIFSKLKFSDFLQSPNVFFPTLGWGGFKFEN